MSVSQTYPFTTPGNYTYDSDEIEIVGGKAQLKLIDNTPAIFNQPFTSDTGFTYDSDEVEFVAGELRQKLLIPTDATFGANYEGDVNGTWGGGVLTGTAIGSAGVTGGKLDLTNGTSCMHYDAVSNANYTQTGTIKFKYTPNYTGYPATNSYLIYIGPASGANNLMFLSHTSSGRLSTQMYSSTSTLLLNNYFDYFSPTSGVEYEIELNMDYNSGDVRLFIDGVQVGTTKSAVGTRSNAATRLAVGGTLAGTQTANCFIDDLMVFNTVQHTANYTPGYTVSDFAYSEAVVELPSFTYSGLGSLQHFTSFTTTEGGTVKYIINDLWWNGSAWVISGGESESNDKSTVLANIATLPASDTVSIQALFSEGSVQGSIDVLDLTYIGQIYPVTNPSLVTNTVLRTDEFISMAETVTVAGSDEIKYAVDVNGSHMYWNGSAWSASANYAQTNTAADINTNAASLVSVGSDLKAVIYIHSDAGTTTPSIDNLIMTGDYAGPSVTTPTTISVYGYIYDGQGNPLDGVTVKAVMKDPQIYNNEVEITTLEESVTTNSIGYWELDLVETTSMSDKARYILTFTGTNYKKIHTIQVPSGQIAYNIATLI